MRNLTINFGLLCCVILVFLAGLGAGAKLTGYQTGTHTRLVQQLSNEEKTSRSLREYLKYTEDLLKSERQSHTQNVTNLFEQIEQVEQVAN
jgi:hypothetical protein